MKLATVKAKSVLDMALMTTAEPKETTIFSIPVGRLGLFSRVMMSGACGFIAFFVAFVLAIIGIAIYDSATGTSLTNLNIAYLYIAAPVGVLALLASLCYLVGAWALRKVSSPE